MTKCLPVYPLYKNLECTAFGHPTQASLPCLLLLCLNKPQLPQVQAPPRLLGPSTASIYIILDPIMKDGWSSSWITPLCASALQFPNDIIVSPNFGRQNRTDKCQVDTVNWTIKPLRKGLVQVPILYHSVSLIESTVDGSTEWTKSGLMSIIAEGKSLVLGTYIHPGRFACGSNQ